MHCDDTAKIETKEAAIDNTVSGCAGLDGHGGAEPERPQGERTGSR